MKRRQVFRIGWMIISVIMLLGMILFLVLPLLYVV